MEPSDELSVLSMEPSDDEVMVIDSTEDMNLVITEVVSLAEVDESAKCKEVKPSSFSALKTSESDNSVKNLSQDAVNSPDEPIPCIENCLVGWREIFPWVQYAENGMFSCSVCKWGYDSPEYFEVYKLEKENGIFSVAGRLRSHDKKKHHSSAKKEQAILVGLCKSFYPALKHSFPKISSIDDIQKKSGGSQNFIADPLSELKIEKKSVASLVIRNIASATQMQFLESLKQSPFFSVVSFGHLNSVIVRWLTQDFEVVEHYFASNLSPTGEEVLPVLAYLQYCGVEMDRMVTYSDLLHKVGQNINTQTCIVNVADRPCPVELCVKWLRTVDFFENYLNHMKVLPKLCQTVLKHYSDPTISEIANIADSEEYMCVFSSEIVRFALSNFRLLDTAVKKSNLENKKKLNFLKLGTEKFSLLESWCINELPKLNDAIKAYDKGNSNYMTNSLKDSLARVRDSDASALKSILDHFIDHLGLCVRSQKTENGILLNLMIKDMDKVTKQEFEYVCKALMIDASYTQIDDLHTLLGRKSNTSPLKLLADLQFKPKYHQRFPELLRLGQKMMTIPALPAHVERFSFEFAAASTFLVGKLPGDLVPCYLYILLEGPDEIKQRDMEYILNEWCKSPLR